MLKVLLIITDVGIIIADCIVVYLILKLLKKGK